MGKRRKPSKHRTGQEPSQSITRWDKGTVRSYRAETLPRTNRLLDRLNVEEILREHPAREDARTTIATARGLMLLLRNIIIAREPLDGMAQWAGQYASNLRELTAKQIRSEV